MSQVFAPTHFGPYVVPLLLAGLCVLLATAYWLISTGIERRDPWRIIAGLPIAGYLAAVFAAAVLFVG